MPTNTKNSKTNTKIKPPPSSREVLDLAILEAPFQRQIIDLAILCGYKAYHSWSSLHSSPGFPDLLLCKPGKRILLFEVKRQKGRVSIAQREWIAWLRAAGIYVRVIRPSDWPLVVRLLTQDDLQDLEDLEGEVAL
jgi:VRR-NUC domain